MRSAPLTRGAAPATAPPSETEKGQIGIFVLGMCVLVLSLVIGIVDVTAVQRARVRLYDVCDAAALDAADALSEGAAYRDGVRARLPVTAVAVREQAGHHLAAAARPDGISSWRMEPGTGTNDGESATVVLTGTVDVPLGASLVASAFGRIFVTVSSTAEGRIDTTLP